MSKVSQDFKIEGIIAAPATPCHPNGDINSEAVKDYVDYLANNNIDGVFILGTLGEGSSLTVDERKQVAEAWINYAKGRLPIVIVQVGAGNLKECIELAQHAQEIKATAIACMLPSYFTPANEAAAVEYIEQVAAAAPDLPFYYYCINFMTGVYLNTSKILELSDGRIPNLRGIKMSSRELPSLLDCKLVCDGRYNIMAGTDEQLLSILALDIRTPILNSFLGNLFKRLREAFDAGDLKTARKEQTKARRLMHIRDKYGGGVPAVKAILRCLGLNVGPVRLPLKDVPEERMPALRKDLIEVGLIQE